MAFALIPISLTLDYSSFTAQKIKFSIKDFFSKCDQTRSFLRIWLHLLKRSLMENFIFCAVLSLSTVFKNSSVTTIIEIKITFCNNNN